MNAYDYQGKGYVTEYANALTRYAFDALGAAKVIISMQIENEKSIAVAKRLHFINEGVKDRDPLDCLSGMVEKNYIYAVNNTDNLPDLKYSWTDVDNNLLIPKIISWAKNTLKITDDKVFASSKVIVKTPWSNVLEINTEDDVIYLKATPELFFLEPAIIQLLHDKFNASVPVVLAANPALNCFLMQDAGHNLRGLLKDNFDENLALKTIQQFTDLQIAVQDNIDNFFDIGVPDYRLEKLPALYASFVKQRDLLVSEGLSGSEIDILEKLSDTVVKLCRKLSSYNIKQTIIQPDFNDNNTLVEIPWWMIATKK